MALGVANVHSSGTSSNPCFSAPSRNPPPQKFLRHTGWGAFPISLSFLTPGTAYLGEGEPLDT